MKDVFNSQKGKPFFFLSKKYDLISLLPPSLEINNRKNKGIIIIILN